MDKQLQKAQERLQMPAVESVLDTALCSLGTMTTEGGQHMQGVSFYDFCYHSKMCSFCGHMAGEAHKLHVCVACKTEHYCNRVCQKKHWAAEHKAECGTLHKKRQDFANMCRQVAACMCVWTHSSVSPHLILHALSENMRHAGLHDVLWLVSYQEAGHAVLFSTVSRELLVECVGKPTVDAAMAKSGPEHYIILIVPTHDEVGGVVYTVVTTFLNATYYTGADDAL